MKPGFTTFAGAGACTGTGTGGSLGVVSEFSMLAEIGFQKLECSQSDSLDGSLPDSSLDLCLESMPSVVPAIVQRILPLSYNRNFHGVCRRFRNVCLAWLWGAFCLGGLGVVRVRGRRSS